MNESRRRPSASLVVSVIALIVALSGTAIAAKDKIQSSDIAVGAVTAKKIKNGAVKGNKIPDGAISGAKLKAGAVTADKIAADTITGSQVANNSLGDTKINDYEVFAAKLTATDGANPAAAQTAAPETVLHTAGALTIYAKCFHDTTGDETFAVVYAKTSSSGAILDGETDLLPGGNAATDFLNTDTLEENRRLRQAQATGTDANYEEGEYALASSDGVALTGQLAAAAKNGTLAGGNGVYGTGNVCLFQGSALG